MAITVLIQGTIPTPIDARVILLSRPDHVRARLMRHHVYWKEDQIQQGLEALVSAAHMAFVDITRHEAALAAFYKAHDKFHDHVQVTVSDPFQKDVMAFCAAAFGMIDTVRRLINQRPDLSERIKK